ncbi:BMP family ABC transporter substrate-binding protein [Oscillochloris sp. ZM17-4]|uniref:BMP family lipoprotein n=1 Tax=Oscillochloris sp. ZM17-4 TaxID=2866714 RepID=UPI001C73902F|nr:BMP family ABC transporter substrate-binding protein [Oscillochloris sp. ZM17-4]MBX0328446.1 BMP family ABC transporter substrate-binding protein [Oscillochloris sp. ZM17-4]
MKRALTRWPVLLILVLGALLSACGGAPASPPAESPATEATEAAEAPAAATEAPAAATEAPAAAAEPYIFGMVLVGPINDGGWNQAQYEGMKYVEERIPGSKFIYIDKVNPADRPNVKVEQVIDELIAQGAKFVVTNSAEFGDGTNIAAEANPDVTFIHSSGDSVLAGTAPANVGNIMGRMEYGKMMSGCAAALQSETGKISYLGPLIDSETRRLVNSAYLGAKYCWTEVLGKPADQLSFKVTWIGFWFNIPGVTLDPTQVANDFINGGSDVILSGIDTTEAIVEANKATQAGKKIYAIPYDYKAACEQAPEVCLGVPYFNWGPSYLKVISDAKAGTFTQSFDWIAPDWSDINNPDTSIVGFEKGAALSADNAAKLDAFIAKLADGSLNLYTGPLNYQDGTEFVAAGATADDKTIWYTEQLLEGVDGQSAP